MIGAGHVVRLREMRNAQILLENLKGRDQAGYQDISGRLILKRSEQHRV